MAVVNGSTQLAAIGARLKVVGGGSRLRTDLLRGLRVGATPLTYAVRAAAREQLPHSGGLAYRVANSPIKTQVRLGAKTAGVRIVASEHDTRPTNAGYVRHPVFGHKDRWVSQEIPNATGWWSKTLEERSPDVTADLLKVMAEVSRFIQGGI